MFQQILKWLPLGLSGLQSKLNSGGNFYYKPYYGTTCIFALEVQISGRSLPTARTYPLNEKGVAKITSRGGHERSGGHGGDTCENKARQYKVCCVCVCVFVGL